MGAVALLFAGQGAQYPGMCQELVAAYPAARAVFEMADAVRPGTSEQCFRGTAEQLQQTSTTQPCVFAADLACARALSEADVHPTMIAGFSLGELAALTFAGALSDEEGFRLVCQRAHLMAQASEHHPGAMRAVLKLDAGTVTELAHEAGDAWPVNYNSPRQTVVAGVPAALKTLEGLVREAGGRAVPLAVSGAFHSPLMDEARDGLMTYCDEHDALAEPQLPVVANMTAQPYPVGSDSSRARAELLANQVCHSVQWVRTLEYMHASGISTFIEVGPGHTLTGLVGRTLTGVEAFSCGTPDQVTAVLEGGNGV